MAELTRPGTWVGPVNYLAPEMLLSPNTADAGPVDVYALAKTLWTILARMPVPIPGPLDRRFEPCRITNYVRDERLNSVELLLEQATRHGAGERPTIETFAEELGAWLRPSSPTARAVDRTALRNALAPTMLRNLSAANAHAELEKETQARPTRLVTQLRPLQELLQDVLGIGVGLAVDNRASNVPGIRRLFEQLHPLTYRAVSLWAERGRARCWR